MIATLCTLAALLTLRLLCAVLSWLRGSEQSFVWRRDIGRDGDVYMTRWQLLRSPWVDVYLNWIRRPDADPLPHNHPWRSCYSVKLRRGYREWVYWGRGCAFKYLRTPARFSKVPRIHRIHDLPDGPALTLFIGVSRRKGWGFFDVPNGGAFIPHGERGRGQQ